MKRKKQEATNSACKKPKSSSPSDAIRDQDQGQRNLDQSFDQIFIWNNNSDAYQEDHQKFAQEFQANNLTRRHGCCQSQDTQNRTEKLSTPDERNIFA